MRRKLANWTEWAWSQGLLEDELARARFVQCVWNWLDGGTRTLGLNGNPGRSRATSTQRARGLKQIDADMRATLKILNYGGRAHVVLRARHEYLLKTVPFFVGSLHRASTAKIAN